MVFSLYLSLFRHFKITCIFFLCTLATVPKQRLEMIFVLSIYLYKRSGRVRQTGLKSINYTIV